MKRHENISFLIGRLKVKSISGKLHLRINEIKFLQGI